MRLGQYNNGKSFFKKGGVKMIAGVNSWLDDNVHFFKSSSVEKSPLQMYAEAMAALTGKEGSNFSKTVREKGYHPRSLELQKKYLGKIFFADKKELVSKFSGGAVRILKTIKTKKISKQEKEKV